MFGKPKSPEERYRIADKKKQKLRDKRSKLDSSAPNYDSKVKKINGKIHEQNVEMQIADKQLAHPAKQDIKKTTNVSFSFNNNSQKKSIEAHGHYHAGKK